MDETLLNKIDFRTRAHPALGGRPGLEEAKRAAKRFEALFVSMLLSELSMDLGEGGFFGEGAGTQLEQGLFVTMLSDEVALKGNGIGLAQRLLEDWIRRGWVKEEGKDERKGSAARGTGKAHGKGNTLS